jgi:hypothetical protein
VNLVGRDREVAELNGLLERAARSAGGALVMWGASGAGKSALADSVATDAGLRGFEVLRIAVGAAGTGRLPWAQLLRDAGGTPEDALRMLEPSGPLELSETVRGLVSSAPRLIVVDDLDRGAPDAVEVLALLVSRLAGSATAVVVTCGAPLEVAPTLRLGPLSEGDLGTLTGEQRPDVRRALWLAASGLPGPAVRLASATVDAGVYAGADPVALLALHAPSQAEFLLGDPPLVRLLESAAERELPAALRARVLARLAAELLAEPSTGPRRRELVDEALALARASGEPGTLAAVLDARLHALWDPAASADRLATASEIIELARAAGEEDRERHGMFWRFIALMELGEVTEAEATLGVFARTSQLAGDARAGVMVTARHAMLATLRGRYEPARNLADKVLTDGRACALADTEALVATIRGMVLIDTGTSEQGAATAESLLGVAQSRPGHLYEATAATVLAAFGQVHQAAAEMMRVLPQVLAASGPRWLGSVCGLAQVAATAHDGDAAAQLYDVLSPYRGLLAVHGGAAAVIGPTSYYLGLLAAEAGRWDEAVELHREAAAMCERIGALPGLARARAALAAALASRARPGDQEAAEYLRRQARDAAEQLGMAMLTASLASAADRWRLLRDGEDWLLDAAGEHVRMRDSRGLHYLRALLASPSREIPALDLVAGGSGMTAASAGPIIDARARIQYRNRLESLTSELDAADRSGDADRARSLEHEHRALVDELRRASGLGGRIRFVSPEAERARVNATRTLRSALDRISRAAPKAGAHLAASVRTGHACRYQPAPGGPSGWDL